MFKTILRKIVAGLVAKLVVMMLWALLTPAPVEPVLMVEPELMWVQVYGVVEGAVSG